MFVMKDFMEKIVKRVCVRITAVQTEPAIKGSVCAKQVGDLMIARLNCVLMIGNK